MKNPVKKRRPYRLFLIINQLLEVLVAGHIQFPEGHLHPLANMARRNLQHGVRAVSSQDLGSIAGNQARNDAVACREIERSNHSRLGLGQLLCKESLDGRLL